MQKKYNDWIKALAFLVGLGSLVILGQTEFVSSISTTTKLTAIAFFMLMAIIREFNKLTERIEELEFEVTDMKELLTSHGLDQSPPDTFPQF